MTYGAIGVIGMLGVALLQLLLIFKVISFEQEVGLVLIATAAVGVWLIIVNFLGRRQGSLPSRLAWLGIAVGVAFVLEPVMLSAAGGAVAWRVLIFKLSTPSRECCRVPGRVFGFPGLGVLAGSCFPQGTRLS
jgi:hypothetical protein